MYEKLPPHRGKAVAVSGQWRQGGREQPPDQGDGVKGVKVVQIICQKKSQAKQVEFGLNLNLTTPQVGESNSTPHGNSAPPYYHNSDYCEVDANLESNATAERQEVLSDQDMHFDCQ